MSSELGVDMRSIGVTESRRTNHASLSPTSLQSQSRFRDPTSPVPAVDCSVGCREPLTPIRRESGHAGT